MIRLKIKEDYKTAKKKPLKSSTIIEVNIVEKSPTIDKKKEVQRTKVRTGQRRNSRATVTIVVRLVISLLTVVLQENTKTKTKAKGKSQTNIVGEMEDADDLCAMIS